MRIQLKGWTPPLRAGNAPPLPGGNHYCRIQAGMVLPESKISKTAIDRAYAWPVETHCVRASSRLATAMAPLNPSVFGSESRVGGQARSFLQAAPVSAPLAAFLVGPAVRPSSGNEARSQEQLCV